MHPVKQINSFALCAVFDKSLLVLFDADSGVDSSNRLVRAGPFRRLLFHFDQTDFDQIASFTDSGGGFPCARSGKQSSVSPLADVKVKQLRALELRDVRRSTFSATRAWSGLLDEVRLVEIFLTSHSFPFPRSTALGAY